MILQAILYEFRDEKSDHESDDDLSLGMLFVNSYDGNNGTIKPRRITSDKTKIFTEYRY